MRVAKRQSYSGSRNRSVAYRVGDDGGSNMTRFLGHSRVDGQVGIGSGVCNRELASASSLNPFVTHKALY